MPRILLEREICLYLRVSGRRGKVTAKDGVIGICRAGLESSVAQEFARCELKRCRRAHIDERAKSA